MLDCQFLKRIGSDFNFQAQAWQDKLSLFNGLILFKS